MVLWVFSSLEKDSALCPVTEHFPLRHMLRVELINIGKHFLYDLRVIDLHQNVFDIIHAREWGNWLSRAHHPLEQVAGRVC